ncbi:MAG: toxin-antitoxin system HicB family antitoxin [Bacteroidales bacterium]|nr:toxin-antitoxin system HicB family antitoxin [Bacteroidales bacterium]
MGVKSIKKQTAFRLDEDLIKKLKVAAKKENRSLNNYVECILMDSLYKEPNETTLAAINEAETEQLETLDLNNFKKYVASL